ncbi:MAG: hypothetical protein ACK4M3_06045 [Pyrobaculum sp.]
MLYKSCRLEDTAAVRSSDSARSRLASRKSQNAASRVVRGVGGGLTPIGHFRDVYTETTDIYIKYFPSYV